MPHSKCEHTSTGNELGCIPVDTPAGRTSLPFVTAVLAAAQENALNQVNRHNGRLA